jgi:hypothetical protein
VLLVEGKKDAIVISALCKRNGITVEIVQKLGNPNPKENGEKNVSFYIFLNAEKTNDDNALKNIKSVFNLDAIQTVGIILDADKQKNLDEQETDSETNGISPEVLFRLQSIQYKLGREGFYKSKIFEGHRKTSRKNLENGIIVDGNTEFPRFGVWLMPDNKNSGMLEDFLIEIIADTNCIPIAQKYVELAQQEKCTSFKPTHKSKAIIHT